MGKILDFYLLGLLLKKHWSKELQNKMRYDEWSTDARRKGGMQRGNKVTIRNHKLLKINDLRVNLLEPTAPSRHTMREKGR